MLTGGRLTAEDSYAYSKFARVALGTNDIDFRARPHSAEEADFLAAQVVLDGPGGTAVTYADLETARSLVLVGLEPEDEAGTVFLRLRKTARGRHLPIYSIAPFTSRGLHKMSGTLIPTRPGDEAAAIDALAHDGSVALDSGGLILVGERAAGSPGALTAVARLAATTGARIAWIPRRAGDRGAVETGALPNLLPGGRPVADVSARVDLATAWGVEHLPETPGRDGSAILAAAASGELGGLVVGGVDPADLEDPALARQAIAAAGFVVSLEVRESEVTRAADVVFPVAPVTDRSGTFVNWEGRVRQFGKVLHNPSSLPDLRVLAGIAEELGTALPQGLGWRTTEQVWAEMTQVGPWDGERVSFREPGDEVSTGPSSATDGASTGGLVLASWKQLDRRRPDAGRCRRPAAHGAQADRARQRRDPRGARRERR